MYVAALGRFVLAIDCFSPNLVRLRRAIQLSNVTDRVVLVQNALFTHSGQFLKLLFNEKNIGGQGINISSNDPEKYAAGTVIPTDDPYTVKTIRFDEVLPILIARGIRAALMKIAIEGSESFVVEGGSRVFDTLDIPFVQMEWDYICQFTDRVKVIFDFFAKRNYDAMTRTCGLLDPVKYISWPSDIFWIKRNSLNFR
jgi:hypothetical protein